MTQIRNEINPSDYFGAPFISIPLDGSMSVEEIAKAMFEALQIELKQG